LTTLKNGYPNSEEQTAQQKALGIADGLPLGPHRGIGLEERKGIPHTHNHKEQAQPGNLNFQSMSPYLSLCVAVLNHPSAGTEGSKNAIQTRSVHGGRLSMGLWFTLES
jgi:hypothetical protein